ncbi:MAG: lamin tail domain-containing protein [Planctomycetota bacterium]
MSVASYTAGRQGFSLSRSFAVASLTLALLASSRVSAEVVINEIHYEPEDKQSGEEFIELFNSGDEDVDLSGWYFSAGIDYTFPEGTKIPGGGSLVVSENPEALAERFNAKNALGPFSGRLSNQGESVSARRRSKRGIAPVPSSSSRSSSSRRWRHSALAESSAAFQIERSMP